MNKIFAIASFTLGIGIFVVGLAVNDSPPILRSTEDLKLSADYDAPIAQVKTTDDSFALANITITNRTTGKAHIRHADADNISADSNNSVGSPSNGLFSTASAQEYSPIGYHSKVPNVQYVKPACPLCSK